MAKTDLTQTQADALRKMEKIRADEKEYPLPLWTSGGKVIAPLISLNKKEKFLLDISRYSISLAQQSIQKQTYQTRARETIVLARFDTGPPHRNPDGTEIGVPHLHIYKEGFGAKYATDALNHIFSNLNDPKKVLHDFMKYCNITQPPNFK